MTEYLFPRSKTSEAVAMSSEPEGEPTIHISNYTNNGGNRQFVFIRLSGENESRTDLDRRKLKGYLTGRKWLGLLFLNAAVLGVSNGYDVSNHANLQIPIYQAFGHIELLPWISPSYSVCNVATIPLARKLTRFYDLKLLGLVSLILIAGGAAVAGAAPNIESVIVGRAITAVGSSIVYQCALNFTVLFSPPHKLAFGQAMLGASFAVGLITGPLIGSYGSGSSSIPNLSYGFYFIIPLCAMAFNSMASSLPRYHNLSSQSPLAQLKEVDWMGNTLHMSTFLLFAAGCTSSGPIWNWSSAPSILTWTLFSLFLVAYTVQQYSSFGTKPALRIFLCWLLENRTVTCVAVCTACAAMAYGVTQYYLPMYFAFAHNFGPFEVAARMLPFICTFIVLIFLSAGLLRVIRFYMPLYLVGGAFIIVGGALLHGIEPETSEGAVMAYTALVGVDTGTGLIFQTGIAVCSSFLLPSQRLDQAAVHNISHLGGVAVALALAGVIYRNVGVELLREAMSGMDYTDGDIRVLLARAASQILAHDDPALHDEVVSAVAEAISRCFIILLVTGALCSVSACFLRWEALKTNKPTLEKETEGRPILGEK
ncbi:major facilitator superfamily domain-containing protein [Biscogniauxia marginata]|nr:major facilitator superfamily domain-containing protein [Biscogniauxia marginata]